MFTINQQEKIQHICAAEVQFNVPLKSYTTLRIGGTAAALVKLLEEKEVLSLADFCREEGVPWLCIGSGSNLLVADDGFAGVVFSLGGSLAAIEFLPDDLGGSRRLVAGGGISLSRLACCCEENGFAGLEFAAGIPGTVGGAAVMNAGAWGCEMSQVIRRVRVAGEDGAFWLEGDDLDFTYRSWQSFNKLQKKKLAAVVAVELELQKERSQTIYRRSHNFAERRRAAQRVKRPNAGSYFKNPPGKSAGRLIEAAGCKGMRVGGAMVAEEHANFFVNMGDATARDMLELQKRVADRVEEAFAVRLQREVRLAGESEGML